MKSFVINFSWAARLLRGGCLVAAPACHKAEDATPTPAIPVTTVTTVAGSGQSGNADGQGATARFNYLWGAALDAQGNLYVADHSNGLVRRITSAGAVTTFANFGKPANATIGPTGIAVDKQGAVYVGMEGGGQLKRVDASGTISIMPGAAGQYYFNYPRGMATDAQGNLYVAELTANRITVVSPAGAVTVLAGSSTGGYADGVGAAARFSGPSAVAVDAQGNVYVADSGNHRIRKITPAGVVTTLAGSGLEGGADGPGATAQFQLMYGMTIDAQGNLYLGGDSCIRRVSPTGEVTTLAGIIDQIDYVDGAVPAARFGFVTGVAGDPSTGLYVNDANAVRKIVTR